MRMKRFFFVFLFLAVSFCFFYPSHRYDSAHCPFCDPAVLQRQKFYEDELCYGLYTHRPVVEGHCLVIPKRHAERFEELKDEEILRMGQVLHKVNAAVSKTFGTSSYLLLQKNGREVGQTVPHVHFHYLPRKEGDCSALKFLIRMWFANVFYPISDKEMGQKTAFLQKAMQDQ